MARLEIGTYVPWSPPPGGEGAGAAELEQQGFDVALYPDSQNLFGEAFSRMGMATASTSRIRLATSVINPVTRHAAIAASAAAAVHRESGGRAILGVGRGDSALAYIGEPHPVPLDRFTRYVGDVRAYVRGEAVDCNGTESRLRWAPGELPPVPVEVACSGERVIRAAVREADRVALAVSAAPERLAWALGIARDELDRCGRDPAEVELGAFLCVGVNPDRARARDVVRAAVATHAIFPTLGRAGQAPVGSEHGNLSPDALASAAKASKVAGGSGAGGLPDEFVDWFAVAGPAGEVSERLAAIAAGGLSYLYLVSHAPTTDAALARECREHLVAEVLPGLRGR